MNRAGKLELTWVGKNEEKRIEPRIGELWCKYATRVNADNKKWYYRLISEKHINLGDGCASVIGLAHNPIDLEE